MSDAEALDFSRKYPKIARALQDSQRFPMNLYRDYDRILVKLEPLWGSTQGHDYLEELLTTQRTDRQGFSDVVATELIRLHLLHTKEHPGKHNFNMNDPFAHII